MAQQKTPSKAALLRELRAGPGVRPGELARAEFRLGVLCDWWSARREAKGVDVVQLAGRVVDQAKARHPKQRASVTTLYRWDQWFQESGVAGLVRSARKARRVGLDEWRRLDGGELQALSRELTVLNRLGLARRQAGMWYVRRLLTNDARKGLTGVSRQAVAQWLRVEAGIETIFTALVGEIGRAMASALMCAGQGDVNGCGRGKADARSASSVETDGEQATG